MTDQDLVKIYATACYLDGYVSVAYPEDEHLNDWVDDLMAHIEVEMEKRA